MSIKVATARVILPVAAQLCYHHNTLMRLACSRDRSDDDIPLSAAQFCGALDRRARIFRERLAARPKAVPVGIRDRLSKQSNRGALLRRALIPRYCGSRDSGGDH